MRSQDIRLFPVKVLSLATLQCFAVIPTAGCQCCSLQIECLYIDLCCDQSDTFGNFSAISVAPCQHSLHDIILFFLTHDCTSPQYLIILIYAVFCICYFSDLIQIVLKIPYSTLLHTVLLKSVPHRRKLKQPVLVLLLQDLDTQRHKSSVKVKTISNQLSRIRLFSVCQHL